MTPTNHLSMAGFGATAIAFGPARMGFGLFLPEFRQTFDLSATLAGLIASMGFLAFLAALPLAARLVPHYGPRVPVAAGALCATIGFLLVSTAAQILQLSLGIMFASASAGLCWAPFNDAARNVVPAGSRSRVLSVIASGTSSGVILAALLSLAVSLGLFIWWQAWLVFALAGLITVTAILFEVPRHPSLGMHASTPSLSRLMCRAAVPLYLTALVFGATNAVYFSFAADRVVGAGGLPGLPESAAAGTIFLAYGACGVLGIFTGRVEAMTGPGWLLRAIFASAALSLALIALAPSSWFAVLASAGLQGAALMSVSAILSFWSLRLFPRHGTNGFTAALVGLALGSVIGPALAGMAAGELGQAEMFLLASLPALLVAAWPGWLADGTSRGGYAAA